MVNASIHHLKAMASSNFSSVLSLGLFLVLLTHANSASETSFNIKTFNEANLILQGNASVSSSGNLRLTNLKSNEPTVGSLGRAFYSAPIQIWDRKTGNVASFATKFKFNIEASNRDISADGLAFALVPVGSQPKGKGGFLGLFDDDKYNRKACTVAVEFDTFANVWDPTGRHIGIDVNSIESVKTTPWELVNGQNETEVRITYDSSTKRLVASQVNDSQHTNYIVCWTVDLQSVLPEWVSVGFSATSGFSERISETHEVLSWSFSSKISDDNPSEGLNLPDIL